MYIAKDLAGFAQAVESLGQERHLLVGAGPEDLSQGIDRELKLVGPEVGVRDGDACRCQPLSPSV